MAWLLCQVASLAAFVPAHCCISHVEEAAKAADEACHEAEPPKPAPGDACPMDHGDGAVCSMHSPSSTGGCVMTNACDGPSANLVTLFAHAGPIERPVTSTIVLESLPHFVPSPASPRFQNITPDSPPPKA